MMSSQVFHKQSWKTNLLYPSPINLLIFMFTQVHVHSVFKMDLRCNVLENHLTRTETDPGFTNPVSPVAYRESSRLPHLSSLTFELRGAHLVCSPTLGSLWVFSSRVRSSLHHRSPPARADIVSASPPSTQKFPVNRSLG
jgi:hypothetical protein